MANKRERSINWEKEEKQLLREIVKSYLPIIENKNLNTNTNKAKIAAWIEITEKFNTINSITRNRKQLMNQWKVTKINAKKILSKHQHNILKTGGGPKPSSPSPETLELVDLLPHEFVVDSNEFDCDGIQDKENIDENLKNIKAIASTSEQPPISQNITEKKIPNIKAIASTSEQPPISQNITEKKIPNIKAIASTSEQPPISQNITEKKIPNIKAIASTSEQPPISQNITEKKIPNIKAIASTSEQPPISQNITEKKIPMTNKKTKFNFAEASYNDMHKFRVMENERLQKEHELRIKHMKEIHAHMLTNLKLQNEILIKSLESLNK